MLYLIHRYNYLFCAQWTRPNPSISRPVILSGHIRRIGAGGYNLPVWMPLCFYWMLLLSSIDNTKGPDLSQGPFLSNVTLFIYPYQIWECHSDISSFVGSLLMSVLFCGSAFVYLVCVVFFYSFMGNKLLYLAPIGMIRFATVKWSLCY